MQVAIPEFDGRLITVPFSFKEHRRPRRRARLRRRPGARRPARRDRGAPRPAAAHAGAEQRVAIVLSSYPTKHARVGNAVGLDTPASRRCVLLDALRDAGYDRRRRLPAGRRRADPRADRRRRPRRRVAHRGAAGRRAGAGCRLADYRALVRRAAGRRCATAMRRALGRAAGRALRRRRRASCWPALRFGNVVLMIQPPRGFGENPVAIYHDPDLPPSHHYLAAYRWLDADDVVRRATRSCTSASTARWSGCPARGSGCPRSARPTPCSATCRWSTRSSSTTPARARRPSAAAHAVVVDHLVPPMARADTYGEHGQARAAARRVRDRRRRSTRPSCRRCARRSGR